MMRFPRSLAFVLTAAIGGAVGAGIVMVRSESQSGLSYAADSRVALVARQNLSEVNDLSTAFREVSKAMRPSVVSISSVQRARRSSSQPRRRLPPGLPEEFRRFFDDDMFERHFEFRRQQYGLERQGLGSGVIISSDGYLVTNNHVVRGADEINVTLSDKRTLEAEVVGTDSKTDLAVLKIDAGGLLPAPLGDSDAAEVGEWVLAIGSPFRLDQTVTAGIISAKGRQMEITDYEDFIQTDAAINPGNSGGPLVNLKGQVIGINTAIASRTGGYMGVGFSIPSNMVRMVKNAIVKHGRVQRGRLGALIQNLDEDMAQSFGFDSTKGVLVGDVLPDSPAEKAGLRGGDIVLEFNGQPVSDVNQLRNSVAETAPNTRSELLIFRNGKKQKLPIVVGELEDEQVAVSNQGDDDSSVNLGMTVQTMTSELAQQLGYKRGEQGAGVTDVEPGSLAARVGIQTRDLIVDVNGKAIRTVADFRDAMDQNDVSQGIRLQVMREGVRRFVFLKSR